MEFLFVSSVQRTLLQNHIQLLTYSGTKRVLGKPLQLRENNAKTWLPSKSNLITNLIREFTVFFAKHITVFSIPDGKLHHLFPKHALVPIPKWLFCFKTTQAFLLSVICWSWARHHTLSYRVSCSHMHEDGFDSFGLQPCSVCQCQL